MFFLISPNRQGTLFFSTPCSVQESRFIFIKFKLDKLLFTRKNGDFGAISLTQRNCSAPMSKVESHISDRCSDALWFSVISEFTQQDGRKKRTAKCLCVTNVTGLLLACYVVIFT